jgi:DNA-binding response OmpR family regulator
LTLVVKSVLRRAVGAPAEGPRVRIARRFLAGAFSNLERRVLSDPANGIEERMTASEFDLLKIFAENPYRPLMRDWL